MNEKNNAIEQDILIDKIDLSDIFSAVWSQKFSILLTTFIFASIFMVISLTIPNTYTSSALLTPASEEDSLTNQLGSYSSLVGFAGIQISSEGGKSAEAMERIQSFDFFKDHFLPFIKFEDLVAAKKWKPKENKIIYNNNIFLDTEKKWVRKSDKGPKPSHQEAYERYLKILAISEDKKSKFVTIKINHVSPVISKAWLDLIISNINSHMRNIDKDIAQNAVDYLNKASSETNLSEIKTAISQLLENQIQILMLTESTEEYVYKIISSPISPEKKSSPQRLLITIFGAFLGLIFGLVFSLYRHLYN